MYTVKEISEMLEVSRQTVYTYMKDNSINLDGHIFKNKGVTYVDNDELRVIKIAMGLIQVPTLNENDISIQNIVDDIVSGLKESLIEDIKAENDRLQELKDQNMELLEKVNELSKNQNKKSFFNRLFKK